MIQEKLLAIQIALKAHKGQRNTFGNYNYRSCEDILEAVKPLLHELGCTLTLSDELVHFESSNELYTDKVEVGNKISYYHSGGDRFYIKATATLQQKGEGEMIGVIAYAREEENKKGMDGSQITGAASSYARKYALNGLFLIDDTKDSDATNLHGKQPEPRKKRTTPKPGAHAETETIKKEDIETIVFKDINTKSELSRTWIDLTKEQQEDEEILNWFTVRKLQLGG